MNAKNEIDEPLPDRICLNSFKKHWAEAQIDGPMHTIARYDDVAKLLITIGGFLLAVLANGYSAMLRDRSVIDMARAKRWSGLVFGLMLIFFFSAAAVCFPQPKMRAWEIMELKDDRDLRYHIEDWCNDLRSVIRMKKSLLAVSTLSFISSFLVMMLLLLSLL
jgi:hypothetical protein